MFMGCTSSGFIFGLNSLTFHIRVISSL
uniref:Uncharacterized protein n=1 Tax=Rhizophora mucronata TaxID=61149 RepID=A0A2P2QEP9_RHIMU